MHQSLEVVEDITNTQLGKKCKACLRTVVKNDTIIRRVQHNGK